MSVAYCHGLFRAGTIAENHIDVRVSGPKPADETQQEFESHRGTKADTQFLSVFVATRRLYKRLFKGVVVLLDIIEPPLPFAC